MSWRLDDLRIRLRTILALPSASVVANDTLDGYINEALRYTLPAEVFPSYLRTFFTLNTTSGTGEYGLDVDMLAVTEPAYVGWDTLTIIYVPQRFFDHAGDRYNKEYGQPTLATMYGGFLWLNPVPDGTYTLRVTALSRPAELKYDADEIFDPAWGLPIIYAAAYKYAIDHGDEDRAATARLGWSEELITLRRAQLFDYTRRRVEPDI